MAIPFGFSRRHLQLLLSLALLSACSIVGAAELSEPGLLFYLSAEKGTTADIASPGTEAPTFNAEVSTIADGAVGKALQCGDLQRLAWRAPGNIYAQRGTLSFFWRSRYPVGPTEFPIFRVGFGDHSSWDMAWLRIDYNGHGFDAFVTDASLARTRVSVTLQPFPKASEWIHLALSWDESQGIRFYVNGKLAAKVETTAVYDTALDQFGPHSRIISPHNVQSDYNFVRGGDIDEIRIYDRMLAHENVAALAKGEALTMLQPLALRSLADPRTRAEWYMRYGWNRPDDPPPYYPGATLSVRKVEIHEAYDMKRWWWKATDGIRETTWPGVYNRSRLPGRNDYFQLPDWDCYVDSGKAITFQMPEEPWNHIEISGAAWGKMELLPVNTALETAYLAKAEAVLFERPKGQERTVHTLTKPITGRAVRFTNAEQEEPIGELVTYYVTNGKEPTGIAKLAFKLSSPGGRQIAGGGDSSLALLKKYILGRYASDERSLLVGIPASEDIAKGATEDVAALPLRHILIPNTWDKIEEGLDGIALDLAAISGTPTQGSLIPVNIQVKDPLWPMRNMLDFSFSVKPGEPKTLWLDLRDRLLPPGRPLYLTLATASDFAAPCTEIRLIFKPREAARAEHELDRFTQAKDSYAMLVEEHPHSPNLNLWVRFEADLKDLLRVNPKHPLGIKYAAAGLGGPHPAFIQTEPPAGVPLWAFRQTELLGRVKHFVNWYIDHRQVEFGDFGGGISDDVDLLNTWPGVALMGCDPEKIQHSLRALIEAAYKNGMFTKGLPTIQADELHSYEEGINCLSQNLILDYGSPRLLERAMETARGVESITGINAAGHRHIRTSYYSGTKMAEEEPWGRSKPYSYLVLQPGQLLVDFNGNPRAQKYMLELADGLLAHRKPVKDDEMSLPAAIRFADDTEISTTRGFLPWHVFWGPWKWTGKRDYLRPIFDAGVSALMAVNSDLLTQFDLQKDWGQRLLSGERPKDTNTRPKDGRGSARSNSYRVSGTNHFVWQLQGDKTLLEKLYAGQIEECDLMDYISTEGSLWIDRVGAPTAELQRARLGGVALLRNALYPGHVISWRFAAPASDQSVAILVPSATPSALKVVAYNLETKPVHATMTGWNIDPGVWEVTQGLDTNNDDAADQSLETRSVTFERSRSLELTLPPRATTVLTLKLKTPGTPYWQRPDLGIDAHDVSIKGNAVQVRVHSLGSVPTPAGKIVLRDAGGKIIAAESIPALAAPVDLQPKTTDVNLTLPEGTSIKGCTLELDPDHQLEEITVMNNVLKL